MPLQLSTLAPRPTFSDVGFEPATTRKSAPLAAGQWVQVLDLPNPFSSNQALLLCPCGPDQWVTWVPDHGEAVLSRRQFTGLT